MDSAPSEVPPIIAPPVAGEAPPIIAPPQPESLHWRDLLIAIPILWGFELAMGIVLVGVLLASGRDPMKDPDPPLLVGTTVVANLFALGVMWYFACRKYRKGFAEAFALRYPGRWMLFLSVVIGLVSAGLAVVVESAFGTGDSMMSRLIEAPGGAVCVAAMAVMAPPFEELYYRGFVFPVLRDMIGARWSIVIVSVWFCLLHAFQLAGDWAALPVILAMGFTWTWLRHRCESLVPSLICHWTYNLCVVLIPESLVR